jgi:hypothetical protein
MLAGAFLVVLGFVGFAFRQKRDHQTEVETNGKN